MVMKKEIALFERDGEGKLIPKEVEVVIDEDNKDQAKFKGETVFIVPLLRGEIRKLFSDMELKKSNDEDTDGNLIIKHCINPAFTDADKPFLKGTLTTVLVNTILFNSGIDTSKPRKQAIQEKEDEFGKNSEESSLNVKKQI